MKGIEPNAPKHWTEKVHDFAERAAEAAKSVTGEGAGSVTRVIKRLAALPVTAPFEAVNAAVGAVARRLGLPRPQIAAESGDSGRPAIDKAGSQVGVNEWTGNAAPDAGPKRYTGGITVVPDHHWSDGILHKGRFEGTDNVSDHANAAWYERSAVANALESKGGGPVGDQEVAKHVDMIKKLAGHPQGKKLLGAAWDKYEKEATDLHHYAAPGQTNLLRGASPSSRASGPVVSHLTGLVSPLVGVANRVLSHAGAAQLRVNQPVEPIAHESDQGEEPEWESIDGVPYEGVDHGEPTIAQGLKKRRELKPIPLVEGAPKPKRDRPTPPVPGGLPPLPAAPDLSHRGDPGGPIKLVEDPQVLNESRYATIKRLNDGGADRAEIIAHLKQNHVLSHRQAADSYRRWVRANDAKQGQDREAGAGPARLARPGNGEPVGPKDLSGAAREYQRGGFGAVGNNPALAGNTSGSTAQPERGTRLLGPRFGQPGQGNVTDRVHDQISDTSLAYHLRQIARDFEKRDKTTAGLAEAILSNKGAPFTGGDPYAELGARLRKAKHRLAGAYNWHTMDASLRRDKAVEDYVRSKVGQPEGMGDREYWDKVRRQFGTEDRAKNPAYDQFWQGLVRHVASRPNIFDRATPDRPEAFLRAVRDSMSRINDRYLDKEYMAAVKGEKADGESRQLGDLNWESVMDREHQGPHKFSRTGQ